MSIVISNSAVSHNASVPTTVLFRYPPIQRVMERTYTPLAHRRKHRASMVHLSGDLPPQQSLLQSLSEKVTEQTVLIQQMSNNLSSNLNRQWTSGNAITSLKQILSCIICKDLAFGSNKQPVVPLCCLAVVGCKVCFESWLNNSQTFSYCRAAMQTVESCASPLPELRPLVSLLNNPEETA